jgi:hypothetical protein
MPESAVNNPIMSTRRRLALWPAVVAMVVCTLLLAASLYAAPKSSVRIITARASGFEPPEVTVAAGKVMLVIHNRSGVSPLVVVLTDQAGATRLTHSLDLGAQSDSWDQLNLATGTYRLSAPAQPEWACQIVVE